MKIRVHTGRRGGFAVVRRVVAAMAVVGQPASASRASPVAGGSLAASSVAAAAVTPVDGKMYPPGTVFQGVCEWTTKPDGSRWPSVQTIFQHWEPA